MANRQNLIVPVPFVSQIYPGVSRGYEYRTPTSGGMAVRVAVLLAPPRDLLRKWKARAQESGFRLDVVTAGSLGTRKYIEMSSSHERWMHDHKCRQLLELSGRIEDGMKGGPLSPFFGQFRKN